MARFTSTFALLTSMKHGRPPAQKLSPQELADAATTKYGMSEKEIQREIQRERQREKDDLGKTRGDSPLLAASANGHPDTLKQLIVAGAQLDSRCFGPSHARVPIRVRSAHPLL